MNLGTLWVTLGVDAAGLEMARQKMAVFQQDTEKGFRSIQNSLDSAGRATKDLGMSMTTSLTLPISILGKQATTTFMNYETSLAHITGLTGTAAELTAQWDKELRGLAVSMGQKPQDLAEALYFIASSGIQDAYAMDILTESARAATAGLGHVKDIADLVTGAMVAYGAENLNAARVVDVLTAAVREGKAEATDLAHALGFVVPNASQLGITFDQLAGTLAAMTTVNIKTNTAAWYLRQILMNILKPSKQAEQALSEMGMSSAYLRNVLASPNGLINALGEINDLTLRYGEDAVAKVFPEVRALTGFLAIMGKNLEHNKVILKLVNDSAGDTQEAFDVVAETLRFQLNQALSELNLALIEVGYNLKEHIIKILNWVGEKLRGFVQWLQETSDTLKNTIIYTLTFAAALGPVLVIVGIFMRLMSKLVVILSVVGTVVASLIAAFVAFPIVMTTIATVITTLIIANNKWKKSIDEVSEAQKALDEVLNTGKELSIGQKRKNIEEAMGMYEELNDRQLSLLEMRISNQIKDEEDYTVQMKQTYKDYYNQLTLLEEQHNKQTEALAKANYTRQKDLGEKLRKEKELRATAGMIAERQRQLQEIKDEEFFSKQRLGIMQSHLEKVQKKREEFAGPLENKLPPKGLTAEQTEAIVELQKRERILKDLAVYEKELGDSFDYGKEKLQIYTSAFRRFIEVELPSAEPEFQRVLATLKELNSALAETAIINKLTKELEKLQKLSSITGDSYETETVNAYKNALKQLVEEVEGAENSQVGKEWNEQIKRINKELQDKKAMEEYTEALSKHAKALEHVVLKQKLLGDSYNSTQDELAAWQTLLNSVMNDDIPDAEQNIDNIIYKIQELENELKKVSRIEWFGNQLADIAGIQSQIYGNMRDEEIAGAEEQAQRMLEIYRNYAQNHLKSKEWLSAKEKAVQDKLEKDKENIRKKYAEKQKQMAIYQAQIDSALAILRVLTDPTIPSTWARIAMVSLIQAKTMMQMKAIEGARMKKGGIVPDGYPNDTYPAMLSSKEVVVPPDKLDSLIGAGRMEVNVKIEGVARGEDIVYVIKEVERRHANTF